MKNIKSITQKLGGLKKLKGVNLVRKFQLEKYQKGTIVIASIVVFFVLNLVFSYISLRVDLSKGKAYTLSSSTKKLAQNLEEQATVTLYTSDNIPARVEPLQREVIDLLREYERAGGNVNIQIVEFNPTEDQETVQMLQQSGIAGLPVREQQQSEVSVTEIYFGIIITYGEKQEVIAQALDVENLEYNITSALYRMTNDSLPLVATISDTAAGFQQQDPLAIFKQVVGGLFLVQDVTSVPPAEGEESEETSLTVDPDAKTLIVIDSAESALSDEQLSAIDDYGQTGNTIIFTDGIAVDANTLQTASGEAQLYDIIAKRGMTVKENLVLSSQSEMVNLGGSGFSLFVPYPLWVVTGQFSDEASYFSGIGRLTFPWVSEIETQGTDEMSVRPLVLSSGSSWTQTQEAPLNPQQIENPAQDKLGEFTLAAESVLESGAKMMVIGSSRFIQSQYLSRESQNLEFMINVLSDYASDGALSGIGRRVVSLYPLPNLDSAAQEFYKYLNIIGLPLLFGAYGGYRLWRRK